MNYPALDDGSIDYLLLNFLEVLASHRFQGVFWMGNNVAEAVLLEDPIY